MSRSAEWSFGVNGPVMREQQSEPGCEDSRLGERNEMAMELELALAERRRQPGNKLTAKDAAEHLDGKKEGAVRGDPVGVVWSKSAGSKHTVDVGMVLQALIPGVEHAEETDFCT